MIMKKTTWACIFVGIAIIIVVAIVITLVLALKKHDKDEPSSSTISYSTASFLLSTDITTITIFESTTPEGASLDDEISLNSTFPNGSLTFDINELSQGSSESAPLEVNITLLNQIGINVDNSSFVAETGRMSFFYIRLPPLNVTRMESDAEVQGNIGIRFGNSSLITVIPLSLASKYDSGLSLVGNLPDSSEIYQLKIRMAENMCSNSAEGACSVISWKPYSISDSNEGSPGNFDNPLPIACGSQCDAASNSQCASSSCTTCDGEQVAGANTPVTRRYKMGRTSGTLMFSYETYSVPDHVTVTYEGASIFDSGCVGTDGEQNVNITFSGKSQELRVDVEPNCDGTTDTAWYFTMPCLSPCNNNFSKDNSLVHLISDNNEIKSGGIAYITKDALMPQLTAYYCDAQNAQNTVQWNFKVEYEYTVSSKANSSKVEYNIRNCNVGEFTGNNPIWNITSKLNSVSGGNATLTWLDSQQKSGTIKFQILGTQPEDSEVIKYIIAQNSIWYAQYIAKGESQYHQFGSSGYPKNSSDYGYGIYQITNTPEPTCDDLWNWKINIDDGLLKIQQNKVYANNWMNKQRKQARDENNSKDIPVPCHAVANCVFMDGSDSPIENGVAIKLYNGAYKHNYCSWNNTRNCWQFNELGSNGNNYVQHICLQVPKNSKTCPPPISNSSNYAC